MTGGIGSGGNALPRRPLVGLALCFGAGCALGVRLEALPPAPVFAAAAVLALAGLLAHRRPAATAALLAATLAAGTLRARLATAPVAPRDLARLLPPGPASATLAARVRGDPVWRPYDETGRGAWLVPLAVEGVRFDAPAGWRRARGQVQARLTGPAGRGPPPRCGDRLVLTGPLRPSLDPLDPVRGRLTVRAPPRFLGVAPLARPLRACFRARAAARRVLARGLEDCPRERAVLEALLLGYREAVPDDVRDAFLRTGTMHVFAVSGLHEGVAALLLLSALYAAGVSRPRALLYLGPLLLFYTIVTGLAASAVRALVMVVAYWSALFFGRRPDVPTALALAGLVLLGAAPTQVSEAGFVYSFVIVAGLILLAPRLSAWFRLPGRPDPWAPAVERRRHAWWRAALRYAAGLITASAAAWVASVPLTARFANLVSPVALLGNLAVVPAAFVIVLTGGLSLLTGAVSPFLAEVFNHAARVVILALIAFVGALSRLPGGHFFVRAPPAALVACWYAVALGLLVLRGRRRWFALAAAAAVAAAAVARFATDDEVRIEVAASLGPAVLVDLPGADDLLFDPGPAYRVDRVVRRLRARGVDRLGALVLTRPDAAHAGGAVELAARVPVGAVWVSPDPGRSVVYRAVRAALAARGLPSRAWCAGAHAELPGGVSWDVLYPPGGRPARTAGEGRLIVRLARDATAVVLAGEAEVPALDPATLPFEPCAPVLVFDGPGDPAVRAALLEAVAPRQVLMRLGPEGVAAPVAELPGRGPPTVRLEDGREAAVCFGRRGDPHGGRVVVLQSAQR